MRGRSGIVGAAVVALVVLASIGGAAAAGGAQIPEELVTCGQIIDHDVRVANSLSCAGHGLVVGKDGVTIDLADHAIYGDLGTADIGIDGTGGFDRVTIKNGTIVGFGRGISFMGVERSTISGLRVNNSSVEGIALSGSTSNTLSRNFVVDSENSNVLLFAGSNANRIVGNIAVSASTGRGFTIDASHRNLLSGNLATANNSRGFFVSNSDRTVLSRNRSVGNGSRGVLLQNSTNTTLTSNRSVGNLGEGVEIQGGTGTLLKENRVNGNNTVGIVSNTNALKLVRNTANRNGFTNGGSNNIGLGINVPAGTPSKGDRAKNNDDPQQCETAELKCHVP